MLLIEEVIFALPFATRCVPSLLESVDGNVLKWKPGFRAWAAQVWYFKMSEQRAFPLQAPLSPGALPFARRVSLSFCSNFSEEQSAV